MKNPNVSRMRAFALLALVGIGLSARAGDLVVPGVWNGSFTESRAYADAQGIPLLLFVGAEDCSSCATVDQCLKEDVRFLDWKRAHGDFVYCSLKAARKDNIAGYLSNPKKYQSLVSKDLADALDFTKGSVIPRIAFYWPGHAPEKQSFSCWKGYMPIKEPKDDTIGQLLACLNAFFADYTAVTSFVAGQTPSDRLEALPTATSVLVPIRRSSGISRTNPTFLVVPRTAATNRIDWASGQTEAFVTVELPSDLRVDDVIDLILLGEEGAVQAESSCRVVTEPECAPKNPLWLGERDAATLRPGEWTMDVDLARACARAAGSFTLNLVGGSLWCPDCVKTDRHFVETPAFEGWLEKNGVYCSLIDVPAPHHNLWTCLLTYDKLNAFPSYVSAVTNGTDIAADDVRVQSGAGYLSRKGADPEQAADVLARNIALYTNLVANGGLCVPGKARLGVPTFVVQNAAGRVIGRLDKFAAVSPTDAHAAAAYVRRLDEILALADDPTEELNRDWSTATTDDCALDIRGGMRTSTVSAVDLSDHWRLTGRDRWTRTTLAVKGRTGGTDETNVRLNLWQVTGGKATKVAMREGNLASGVTLPAQEIAADPEVEYFVQVEAIETSAAFALDRDGDSVAAYDLTAESADDAGTVSFGESARTVSEAEAKRAGGALRVRVPAVRTGGASGATNATVTVDAASTAFSDRYRLVADTVAWADGERGTKNFEIDVFDDGNADGAQVLRLLLGAAAFELTIEDNDRLNVGKLAFADAEPALAKKGLVIAEEGARVRIGVARLGGASGGVSCALKATAGAFAAEPTFAWASRASGTQWAELDLPLLADCPAGKVTLSFAALEGGVKADASARTLTVQLVGADAPRFETDSLPLGLTRYCAVSQEVAVLNLADGAKAKVAKLSGSVPSGVSVKLAGGRLVVSGAPTAKGGAYEAVYQVSQTVGRKTEPGLTIRLAFAVTDVAALDPSAPGANPSVRARRTVPDMMVIDEADRRLVGILSNLTIQPTGRCTAKYRGAAGVVSLASRGWAGYDAATGALTARLTVAKKPYALAVTAQPDGMVEAALTDPDFADGLAVVAPATAWSRENPATAWVGAYTAAFGDAEGETLANGAPVVTLQMAASAARTGTMRYAGFLPNGQAFSGSSVLVADGVDAAWLPIYYRTAKDFFTAVLRIKAGGAVQAVTCDADIRPGWTHTEALPEACSDVRYGSAVGSRIDARQDLLETVDPAANGHDLVAAGALESIPVVISGRTATLDPAAARAVGATLSLNRATGLLSGRFRMLDAAGKTVTANYRGVLLPDWGDGCPTCGDVPWAMGAYWFGERLTGELDGRPKTLTVKVGDTLYIEAN